jgi:polysaccharide biosynthesis protein PslH
MCRVTGPHPLTISTPTFDTNINTCRSVSPTDIRKRRVLVLTQRFPYPPDRGDRIRSYNLIKFLADYYDITVGCTTHEPVAGECLDHLRSLVSNVMVGTIGKWQKYRQAAFSVASGASVTEGYFYSPPLAASLRKLHLQSPFDAVLIYCSSMFQYRQRGGLQAVPAVVDLVDVDSQKWKQLSNDTSGPMRSVYRLETQRTQRLERTIASTARSVALTSHQEADLFCRTVGNGATAFGISNGVDTSYFRTNASRQIRQSDTIELIFTGVMDYPPNVEGMCWFCRDVWPLITQRLRARLKIVGRRPTQAVQELGRIAGIEVVGEVPDVRPYLDAADIAISPLHLARGIQNKVLEAMASGLPVVVTPPSAEGIDAENGVHLQIADSAAEFANAVVKFGLSRDLRGTVGAAARELVEDQYSWPAKLNMFRDLIEQACSK